VQWMSIARLSSARQRAMWVGWRRSCLSRCQCPRRGRSARLRGRCPPFAVFHPRRLGSRQNSLVESRPGPPTTALKGVVRLRWRRGPGSARLGRPPPPPPPTHTHTHTVPRSAPFPPQRPLPQAGVGVAQDGAGHDLRDAGARALATAGHHRRRLGRGYGARGLRLRGGDVWGGWVGGWGVPGSFVGCSTACGECVPRARDDVGRSRHLAARRTHTLEAQSCVARWPCAHCVRDTRYLILFYSGLQHPTPKRATGRSRPSKRRAGDLATKIAFHERLHRLLHIVLAAGSCAPDRARCAARPAWLHDCWLVAGATSPQRRLPASERLRARAPASNTSAPQACTAGAPPAQLGPTVISGAAVRRGRAHAEQAPTELCRAGAT
jgi:hypothetical protein